MIYSPQEWYSKYSGYSYKSYWKAFEIWLKKKNLTWKEILEKNPSEIRNTIDEYLISRSKEFTTKSMKNSNAIIRSFFSYNDILIPKSRITVRGKKPMNLAKLTPDILKKMIDKAKPRDSSLLMFKFQCFQDSKRMVWINKNAWPQIKPQLEQKGFRDRNGKLWENILKIDIPVERKKNEQPYFCFVGSDSIKLLKEHLDIQGVNGCIWEGLTSEGGMGKMALRLIRRFGLIQKDAAKNSGARYGYNIHEFRDVSKSLWHESGADLNVWKFLAGQTVDPLGYDKIYTLSPDYAVKEYKKAESYLNLLSFKKLSDINIDRKKFENFEKKLLALEELVNKLTRDYPAP